MKKILFTGGSGFVGKNVIPFLSEKYKVYAPDRNTLNLRDPKAVREYLGNECFDAVVHCANPNPVKNSACDSADMMFEDSLRCFMHFYNQRDLCGRILYLGSGAEFNKTMDMSQIREEEIHRSMPEDEYGCAKYIMNELASAASNIYNLRLFACYGPYDHESKFITHAIRCCLKGEDITIRQNCMFDYLHVYDLEKIMEWFIDAGSIGYHDYNIASGVRYSLSDIADEVRRQMHTGNKIVLQKDGWNKEYTADISRLRSETGITEHFISLSDGIAMQIKYEQEKFNI